MTGTLTDSRHTEHSSSDPLANTTRSFSIKRSRISAGVAEAPKYVVWKIRVLRVAVAHTTNWDSGGGEKKYHQGLQRFSATDLGGSSAVGAS